MTTKQQIKEILEELPDDCTIEDVQYHLYVVEKVKRGLAAADKGGTVSHAEIKDRVKQWLTK